MLFTDCYLLKLSGPANSTSAKNETAAFSKAVTGAKFGSTLLEGRRALFILRNNWDCANRVSTDHHRAKIQQKVLWSNLFFCSSPFIAITLHSSFIQFRYWNFAIFVDLSDAFRKLVSFTPVKPTSSQLRGTVWNKLLVLPNSCLNADPVACLKPKA